MHGLKLSSKAIKTLLESPNAQLYWLEKSGFKCVAWWDGISDHVIVEDGTGKTSAIISAEPPDIAIDLSIKGYYIIAYGIPHDGDLNYYAV